MRSTWAERIVYFLSTIGLIVTGSYLFFQKPQVKRIDLASSSIGSIHPLGSDVRVRGKEETSWNTIRLDANIFHHDKVYTGNTSSAIVKLKSNQKLTIEPNSLIVIGDKDDKVFVNLDSGGGFLGEIRRGVKLFVKRAKVETEIEGNGATIQLQSYNKDEIKMVVLKGEALVKNNGQKDPIKVQANVEAKITEQKTEIQPLKFSLTEPEAGAVLWNEKNHSLHLSWDVLGKKAPGESYLVEISKDPLFNEDKIVRRDILQTEADISVPSQGVYFWRVQSQKSHDVSATSSFSSFDLLAPVINENSVLQTEVDWQGHALTPITFAWQDPSLSDSYEFQIAKESSFTNILDREITEASEVSISSLQAGTFYWRVISRQSSRKDLFSKTGRFVVLEKEKPQEVPVPTLVQEVKKPVENVTAAPQALQRPEWDASDYNYELVSPHQKIKETSRGYRQALWPQMSWTQVPGAESYLLEISKDKDFTTVLRTESVIENQWTWKQALTGQFYERVSARRGDEKVFSEIVPLRVILAPPQLQKFQVSQKDPQKIEGTWSEHELSQQTEIQVSIKNSSEAPQVYKVKGKSISFRVDQPNTYNVRARSLNEDGWPISRFSDVQEVVVPEWRPVQKLVKEENILPSLEKFPVLERAPAAEELTYQHDPQFSLYLGSGMQYLSFSQKGDAGSDSVSFSKISTPTQILGMQMRLSAQSHLLFEYNLWPGRIKTDGFSNFNESSYTWRSFVGEYQYKLSETPSSSYELLLGVQQHKIPFINTNSSDTVDVLENQMLNASMGFKARYLSASKDYEYELFFRYQRMLNATSTEGYQLNISPGLIYDGSIGVSRLYHNGFKMGVYWFGQQQDFRYEFRRDSNTVTGTQSLFNSNIQFRMGWEFYSFMTLTTSPFILSWRRRRAKKKAKARAKKNT